MERGLQRVHHQGHLAEWSQRVEAYRKSGQREVFQVAWAGQFKGFSPEERRKQRHTAPTLNRTVEGRVTPLLPAHAPESCATA